MAQLRKCIGSAKFGIEAHDAPVSEFPKQPSQKDGLGRMCRTHWNAYATALRKAALERKAAQAPEAPATESVVAATAATEAVGEPATKQPRAKRGHRRSKPATDMAQGGRRQVDRPAQANTQALGAKPGALLRCRAALRSRDVPRQGIVLIRQRAGA